MKVERKMGEELWVKEWYQWFRRRKNSVEERGKYIRGGRRVGNNSI